MTKKALTIIALTVVLSMVLGMSAFAAKATHADKVNNYLMPTRSHVERSNPVTTDPTLETYVPQKEKAVPVGSVARFEGQGVGTPVDETFHDYQWGGENESRHIAVSAVPDGGNTFVDIHFHNNARPADTIVTHSNYQSYQVNGLGWTFGGALGGTDLQSNDTLSGVWGGLDVRPNGLAVLHAWDREGEFADTLNGHTFYYQTAVYGQPASKNWITTAQLNPFTINPADNNPPVLPAIAITELGGNTIIHCVVLENGGLSGLPGKPPDWFYRHLIYFRNDNATLEAPGVWSDGAVIDTVLAFVHTMAAERNGTKVAAVWWSPSDTGEAQENVYDDDLYYAISSDTGNTWTSGNATNYQRDVESGTALFEFDAVFDENGNLHVAFTAAQVMADPYRNGWNWLDFNCNVYHWADHTNRISLVGDGNYDEVNVGEFGQGYWNVRVCGFGPDLRHLYTQKPNIAQCGDYMYITWAQIHHKINSLGASSTAADTAEAVSDCSDDTRFGNSNHEIFLSVSSDLDGNCWDSPRNLTNTFTPDCQSPDSGGTICGNEVFPNMSHDALDVTGITPALNWPTGNEVIPAGATFTSNKYLQVFYLDDLVPDSWYIDDADPSTRQPYNNDMRWFRLACVEPETAPSLTADRGGILWPEYVENGQVENYTVNVTNNGNTGASPTVTTTETTGSGWLSTTTLNPISACVDDITEAFDIVITAPAGPVTQFLEGIVTISSADPNSPIEIPVKVWTAPAIEPPGVYDTSATSSDWDGKGLNDFIALTVSNHGEQGRQGAGGVNLDFVVGGTDCNTDATVYLYSGSPFFMVKNGTVSATSSHYTTNVAQEFTWTPLTDASIESGTTAAYDSVFAGRMANRDTTMWMERTFYAPRNNPSDPSFVVVKTVVGTDADITDSVALGEIIDWDVPSDDGADNTSGTTQPSENQFVYFRGTDTLGSDACISNTRRFATMAFHRGYVDGDDPCDASDAFWGAWGTNVRGPFDLDTLTGEYQGDLWWDSLYEKSGLWATSAADDQGQFMTYEFRDGLASSEQLVYWSIYATGYDMDGYENLDTLVTTAKDWADDNLLGCVSGCCVGDRGNVDNSPDDAVTLGDLTVMIDILFISLGDPACWEETNLDGSTPEGPGSVTLGDLTVLIDHLFISLDPLPACP
ncbi:hypothetical protein GF377_04990 [candidate division GN15 bacterium]|nr:hypothetical protein [candidate division GN15 bacterium]